jgi:hypothetical protein
MRCLAEKRSSTTKKMLFGWEVEKVRKRNDPPRTWRCCWLLVSTTYKWDKNPANLLRKAPKRHWSFLSQTFWLNPKLKFSTIFTFFNKKKNSTALYKKRVPTKHSPIHTFQYTFFYRLKFMSFVKFIWVYNYLWDQYEFQSIKESVLKCVL